VEIQEKYNHLKEKLLPLGKVLVSYSGGVDSTFLLKVAADTLGKDKVLACISAGPWLPKSQYDWALRIARDLDLKVETVKTGEMQDESYLANKADRCFRCKSHLFEVLTLFAQKNGCDNVLCGSNFDDKDDYRPGNRAAQIYRVQSPLMDAKLTKQDIRRLSRELDLPTAEMPASPCLATRIRYGLRITPERLKQVEQAEEYLKTLGLVEFRLRHHGKVARIEVHPQKMPSLLKDSNRAGIIEKLRGLGFQYITLDLQGFRSGSMNESLTEAEKKGHNWSPDE